MRPRGGRDSGFDSHRPDTFYLKIMSKVTIKCSHCGKAFQRERSRYNEAEREGWNQYCSLECQRKSKITRVEKICANPECNKKVSRLLNQFKKSKSGLIFCSHSCSAIVNNSEREKTSWKKQKISVCHTCGKEFIGSRKYCSSSCRSNVLKGKSNALKGKILVTKEQIIKQIEDFYKKHGRIPVKREFHHYKAARLRFGTWNKAVKVAGFKPNPVIFAERHKAKDGHICDSLSEKIIDDWLSENNLKHKINTPYPKNSDLTCDFVVDKYFIEFFGLEGEHQRYTELVKEKRKLAQKYKLNLIELKPKHLFPKNKLDTVLNFLLLKTRS